MGQITNLSSYSLFVCLFLAKKETRYALVMMSCGWVSGQRLERTKVRTNGNSLRGIKFNKKENQCEHTFGGSDQ